MKDGQIFGVTNGIITMLSLMTGLRATKVDKVGIIGAILAMIIADPLSDAYSIYYAEKQNNNKNAFNIGKNAFLSQFILQFIFLLIIILCSDVDNAIYYSYIFGILLTISYGFSESISYLDISKNLLWIVSLVYITYISDLSVYSYFK